MNNRLLPIFLASSLALGGCATHRVSTIHELNRQTCLKSTVLVETKGKGDDVKEVSRRTVTSAFDETCRQQETDLQASQQQADARLQQERLVAEQRMAQMNIASTILATGLKNEQDPIARARFARNIVDRLDSQDASTRQSQAAALATAGITVESVRSLVVRCRSVTRPDGKIMLDCE